MKLFLAALIAALSAVSPQVRLSVKDVTPRFMAFWRAAQAEPEADGDRRFALWKSYDGFAAVPPTAEGDVMARQLLDAAWPKYPALIPRIVAGAAGMSPDPEAELRRVTALLHPVRPVDIQLTVYAGMAEHNAFTFAAGPGRPVVSVPVEMDAAERGPILAHEFTHAVQISQGTTSGGWVRSVGETALAEGLASRVAQRLYPRRAAEEMISAEPGWLAACDRKRTAILMDVRQDAAATSSDAVTRFTIGVGPSGVRREAYYAGWLVVNHWLRQGRSFSEIARIPEADAPAQVTKAIDELLGDRR